jgi:hypothetical protein
LHECEQIIDAADVDRIVTKAIPAAVRLLPNATVKLAMECLGCDVLVGGTKDGYLHSTVQPANRVTPSIFADGMC